MAYVNSPYYAYPTPIYQPAMRIISNITNDNPGVVTTTFAHLYKSGTIVRLIIPLVNGMQQANNLTGAITVLGSTTFAITIDTTGFEAWINVDISSSGFVRTNTFPYSSYTAMVVPIGDTASTLQGAVVNVVNLPQPPTVPF